jgi:carboxyl-terminal processing protease
MSMRFASRAVTWGLLLAALVLLTNSWAKNTSVFDQLDLLVDVRHELTSHYVEEPDEQAMTRAAVEGMVESLDDPYTNYLSPDALDSFNRSMQGQFQGIGAQVDEYQNRPRIVTPLEDSPAWEAGVMAGDIILEIEGEDTLDLSLNEAVDKLTGKKGTDVTITVRHENGEEEQITITRDVINVQTVRGFQRGNDGYMLNQPRDIAYIRITQFSTQTSEELREALQTIKEDKPSGLILDLRFNPGGLLQAAVEVSDMFLQDDQTVVSVKGRTVEPETHKATGETVMPEVPIVVLANEASASAAEIVTGALKDNDRGHVVGTRTFGKGSVQQLRMLESGQGALKITNAYYYLPSGRNIHRREGDKVWGVDPSEGSYVPMSQDAISEMIEIRREQNVLRRENGDSAATQPTIDPQWLRDERKDPQLAAALEAMMGLLEKDRWPKVGQSNVDQLAQANRRQNLRRQRDMLQQQLDEVRNELNQLQTGAATQPQTNGPATQPTQ